MAENEASLLKRFASEGDPEAFRELVERHREMVFSTCYRILNNAADAEDASQQCFMQMIRRADKLHAPIAGWLHNVARQLSIDMRRQDRARSRREALAMRESGDASESKWEDIRSEVDGAIAALPERLRVAVVMCYLEGCGQEEIARELGLSQSAVSKRISRGIDLLRRNLRKAGWTGTTALLASLLAANAVESSPSSLAGSLEKLAEAEASAAGHVAGSSLSLLTTVIIGIAAVAAISAGGYFFYQSAAVIDDYYEETGAPGHVPEGRAFISTWDTTLTSEGSSGSNQIRLPIFEAGNYNFVVDWGDGIQDVITSGDQEEKLHTYAYEGVYTITITGQIEGWAFDSSGDRLKIVEVGQWGDLRLGDFGSYFNGTENLKITATDKLNLAGTKYMFSAFAQSGIDNVPGMNEWDVSQVTDMNAMFYAARNFNQDIGDWDTSNVTVMRYMFSGAFSFNQDIGGWDISNVENIEYMFSGARAFNQDIGRWDVSNLKSMRGMFQFANSFNQDIGGWDVSNVENMQIMFAGARSFDQDISRWDVSRVQDFSGMFNTTAFNQDIGGWDLGNAINMDAMFRSARFFDQNIGGWDVSNVENMRGMFRGAVSFDQDISGWDVSQVTDMTDMFTVAGLSTENYDNLLIGWANLPALQEGVVFGAGNSQYSERAAEARALMVNEYNWTITDGGPVE